MERYALQYEGFNCIVLNFASYTTLSIIDRDLVQGLSSAVCLGFEQDSRVRTTAETPVTRG